MPNHAHEVLAFSGAPSVPRDGPLWLLGARFGDWVFGRCLWTWSFQNSVCLGYASAGRFVFPVLRIPPLPRNNWRSLTPRHTTSPNLIFSFPLYPTPHRSTYLLIRGRRGTPGQETTPRIRTATLRISRGSRESPQGDETQNKQADHVKSKHPPPPPPTHQVAASSSRGNAGPQPAAACLVAARLQAAEILFVFWY